MKILLPSIIHLIFFENIVLNGNELFMPTSYTFNMKENNTLKKIEYKKEIYLVKNYDRTISDLLYERFWEDATPVNKMLKSMYGTTLLGYDEWANERAYIGIDYAYKKKWIANVLPSTLLNRTFKEAVESISTLSESGDFYEKVPKNINPPDYGDKWGRNANYIEINNRTIAKMQNERCSEGILSAIKLLPAIPPSARSWANCVILSQIFPNIFGDGYNKEPWTENSLYGIRLNAGYSDNVVSYSLEYGDNPVSPQDQIRAFNDLAHMRGLKTGFRMLVSEDQLKIAHPVSPDEQFRWENAEHLQLFINANVEAIKLGFDSIFFDSLKHVNGHEWHFYTGVGRTPDYEQMQYIFYEIRRRSERTDLSFVGERCDWDINRYKNMGLTAGTAWGDADDFEDIKRWSKMYKHSREYAPGPEVSNDNDEGGSTYEERLNKLRSCLFGYEHPCDKLPSFMQMHDLFPLRYDTNTHHLMMCNPSYSGFGDPHSHWNNLFTKDDGKLHNHRMSEIFAYALNM